MRRPERLVLLGHPLGHSLSPRFQNAALVAAGIPLRYDAVDVDPAAFEEVVDTLRRERTAGNVTIPFKERMHDACDVLTPLARRVGAVNVFWVDDRDRLVGDNSDVGGFDATVLALLGERPRDAAIGVLGAGGAAAAVLAAIESWAGCSAHVLNRTPERARLLCERFGAFAQPVDDVGVIAGAQLVVNATSIGLHDSAYPLDPALIAPNAAVIDLVYRPGETAWTHAVRARGHRACDGLPMLIEQGALAFERWFGISPSRSVMWESLPTS